MRIAETWMPVSGKFKAYPLAVTLWTWEDGPVMWSKGHHDPLAFLQAAVQEWHEYDDCSLTLYENGGWEDLEGPAWPPSRLRTTDHIRHEWWANRQMGDRSWHDYIYICDPGPSWRRGAYPVTVVML